MFTCYVFANICYQACVILGKHDKNNKRLATKSYGINLIPSFILAMVLPRIYVHLVSKL